MDNGKPDFGYLDKTIELMRKIEREQQHNIEEAARLMATPLKGEFRRCSYNGF